MNSRSIVFLVLREQWNLVSRSQYGWGLSRKDPRPTQHWLYVILWVKECELVSGSHLMAFVPFIIVPTLWPGLFPKPYFLMPQSHLGLKCNICILRDTNIYSIMASLKESWFCRNNSNWLSMRLYRIPHACVNLGDVIVYLPEWATQQALLRKRWDWRGSSMRVHLPSLGKVGVQYLVPKKIKGKKYPFYHFIWDSQYGA